MDMYGKQMLRWIPDATGPFCLCFGEPANFSGRGKTILKRRGNRPWLEVLNLEFSLWLTTLLVPEDRRATGF